MLSYDASGDVIRDPSVNFQDAYAPPTNAAIGYHHNNQIQTAKWTSQNAKEIVTKWWHEVPKEIIYSIDNVCDHKLYKQLGQKYTRFF